MSITMDNVIRNRQRELMEEIYSIDTQIIEWEKMISEAKTRREMRIMEYQIMEDMENRNIVSVTTTTTTTVTRKDKLGFEDCLVRIFDNYGRPMKISEIIDQLEKFSYQWSTPHGAYQYITKSGMIERASHGYYNLVRKRGW